MSCPGTWTPTACTIGRTYSRCVAHVMMRSTLKPPKNGVFEPKTPFLSKMWITFDGGASAKFDHLRRGPMLPNEKYGIWMH